MLAKCFGHAILVMAALSVCGAAFGADIYVDDDDLTCGGQPLCHATIGSALASAVANDTITVLAGTYPESVHIDKAVTLQGVGASSSVVDASGFDHGIFIDVGGVTLKNLGVHNSNLRNIVFYVVTAGDVLVDGVESSGAGVAGIEAHQSALSNLTLTNSKFSNNTHGMRVDTGGTVNGLTIDGCEFNNNDSIGVYLIGSVADVSITNTDVVGNGLHGGYFAWMDGASIEGCLFEGNGHADNDEPSGIKVSAHAGQPVQNVTIVDSVFRNNGNAAVTGVGDDVGNGLLLSSKEVESSNISIQGCTFDNNKHHGVLAYGRSGGSVTGVTIGCSTIVGNSLYGVSTLYAGAVAASVLAENNWWGAASGPTHPSNAGGTGDAVTDNVDYDPWLAGLPEDAPECQPPALPARSTWMLGLLAALLLGGLLWRLGTASRIS